MMALSVVERQFPRLGEIAAIGEEVFMQKYIDDDDILSDDDRLREIAALLAAGILRLRCRAALPAAPAATPDPENPPIFLSELP
jgi:hypothetical protein